MALFALDVDFSGFDNVVLRVAKKVEGAEEETTKMLNSIGLQISADAVEMIQHGQPRTGVEYQKGGKTGTRSAKGEPAKSEDGILASSVFAQITGDDLEIGYLEAIAPYGKYLEDTEEYHLDRKVLGPAATANGPWIGKLVRQTAEKFTEVQS